MSKRGAVELFILIVVIVIAIVGLYIALRQPTGQFVNVDSPLYQYNYPGGESPIVSCQRACINFYPNDEACLARCQEASSVGDPYAWKPTGKFAVPGAQEYGGGIRGIYDGQARAFPGRAFEMPGQDCYKCSCLTEGITSATREAAERVCSENCGGVIAEVSVGACR